MAARITATSADALRESAASVRITAASVEAHRDASVFNPQLRLTAISVDVLRPVAGWPGWPLNRGWGLLSSPPRHR